MRAQGGGRIINFSDWVARSGRPRYPGFCPYYVAKAGVIALTEALALELAGDNILVNAIAPGPILAPPETSDEEIKAVEEATPLGRWGGESEIAKAVLALHRQRLHHRRDHPRRWRTAPQMTQASTELQDSVPVDAPQLPVRRRRRPCRECGQDRLRAADRQVADVEVPRAGIAQRPDRARADVFGGVAAAANSRVNSSTGTGRKPFSASSVSRIRAAVVEHAEHARQRQPRAGASLRGTLDTRRRRGG